MRRRAFIAALGGAAAWPVAARAQNDRVRRVVVVMAGSESDPRQQLNVAVFREGLRRLGKWLQVLKELAPHVTRVAMTFGNATRPVGENFYRALQAAAGPLSVETTAIRIDSPLHPVQVG